MKKRMWIGGLVVAGLVAVGLTNASQLAAPPEGKLRLLSHRGVYQRYDRTGLTNTTCTAARIFKPTHDMLENTLPSMKAAFDYGADVVELDVHPTRDGQFVVFHDWTVDCRTDGHGVTREQTLAQLQALDIGHGYTYDGGKTFPFRGRFKGQMPSLIEVLKTFPGKHFLINIKSNNPREAEWLMTYLRRYPESDFSRLSAYGSGRPAARLKQIAPEMMVYDRAGMMACGKAYLMLGWSGYFPKACKHTTLFLPTNLAPFAWGYPNRLQARFAANGSYIYLLGKQKGKVGMQGVNTADDFKVTPASWRMGVLTDEIETVGPMARSRGD
jgi:glycerophosphoryl diester phosphodiesterase